MFKWLKKLKGEVPVETYSTRAFHIERRQHARIRFPTVGALGDLPFISFQGHELRPANLSMGGILVTEKVMNGVKPGSIIDLVFSWKTPAREIIQKTNVVRVSSGGCHLRFEDLNPQLLVNLSLALKPGVRAQKTVRSEQPVMPIQESWKSASGEQLLFSSAENEFPDVRIHLPPKELTFSARDGLRVGTRTPGKEDLHFDQTAPAWILHDLIVFLTNLPTQTPRVKSLLFQLEKLL
ncbi:MAG: PilZ domain-containing protein [Bdellovibrionia bacterium]